jgi:hypothetical protein
VLGRSCNQRSREHHPLFSFRQDASSRVFVLCHHSILQHATHASMLTVSNSLHIMVPWTLLIHGFFSGNRYLVSVSPSILSAAHDAVRTNLQHLPSVFIGSSFLKVLSISDDLEHLQFKNWIVDGLSIHESMDVCIYHKCECITVWPKSIEIFSTI